MGITTLAIISILFYCFYKSLQNPTYGVVGYLIIYVVYGPGAWYGDQLRMILFRPSLVVSAGLLFACLINTQKLNWKFSRSEIAIYLFVGIAFLVSYFFGIGVEEINARYLEKLFKISIFIFLLIRAVHHFSDYQTVIWALIGSGFFIAMQARRIGSYAAGGRLDNMGGVDFSDANGFGAFMITTIVLIGFKLFRNVWWKKMIIAVVLAVMLDAFIMTQSRAVFLGLICGIIFLILKAPRGMKKKMLVYFSLAAILFGMLAHDKFWDRMDTVGSEYEMSIQKDPLFQGTEHIGRLDFWKSSIAIFRDHPMGIGVKNFQVIVPFYDSRNTGWDAHNTYVLCYSEIGILGILLFLGIIFTTFYKLRKIYRFSTQDERRFDILLSALSFATVLLIYVSGPMVTHSYLYSEFTWILFALPICLENSLSNYE